jgi:hypothetical protein
MSVRVSVATVLVIVASIAIAVGAFGLSLERALLLAPVFVLTVGAAGAFVVVTAKVVRESRERRGPP